MYSGVEGVDYVKCPICGYTKLRIYIHLKKKHNLSVDEFHKLYPGYETTALKLREQTRENTKKSLNTPDVVAKRKSFRSSEEGRKMAASNGAVAWKNKEWVKSHNKAVSVSSTKMWQDEEFRKSQSEKITKALNTPEVHQKHHDRLVKQWKDEEYRKYICECINKQFDEGKFGVLHHYIDVLGNEVSFRSSWELSVHNILTELHVIHEYEPHKYKKWFPEKQKYLIYRPDFYLPDYNIYLEVKPNNMQQDEINQLKRSLVIEAGQQIYFIGDNEYNNPIKIKELLNSTLIQRLSES